jgi:hypothetical protein
MPLKVFRSKSTKHVKEGEVDKINEKYIYIPTRVALSAATHGNIVHSL